MPPIPVAQYNAAQHGYNGRAAGIGSVLSSLRDPLASESIFINN